MTHLSFPFALGLLLLSQLVLPLGELLLLVFELSERPPRCLLVASESL